MLSRKSLLWAAWIVAAVLCADSATAADLRLQIRDSGYLGRTDFTQNIYWVDNENILFIGTSGGHITLQNDHREAGDALLVWNLRSGIVRPVDESVRGIRSLCFRSVFTSKTPPKYGVPLEQGYVRYVHERDGIPYVRFGRLFSERERPLDTQAIKEGTLSISPVSCREFNPKQLKGIYGRNPLPLIDADEYLDRTDQDVTEARLLRYFPSRNSSGVDLRIASQDVFATPRYSEYSDKYVFWELRTRFAPAEVQRVWLLDRSGAVHQTVIPAGPWMQGATYAMPSKKGWFFVSMATSNNAGGAYLLGDKGVSKIVAGYPGSFAISPDGCKAALSINGETGVAPRTKMIDLCVEE